MKLIAIDPGTTESAFVIFDTEDRAILLSGKWTNPVLLRQLQVGPQFHAADELVIEMIGHYGTGMAPGREVYDTCVWIGRFWGAWDRMRERDPQRLLRKAVAGHICNDGKAKDKNIRCALIDRWGGEAEAIGGKKCQRCKGKAWIGRERAKCPSCGGSGWRQKPGPLLGVAGDVWSALAVAVTYAETVVAPPPTGAASATAPATGEGAAPH